MIPLNSVFYLVYAPLKRVAFIGNSLVINALAHLQAGSITDVQCDPDFLALLRNTRLLDDPTDPNPLSEIPDYSAPTTVSLFLTTACNLRCTYCYASAGRQNKFMPFEIARRGIDFVVANALRRKERRFEISYHGGGEPTLNWSVMTKSYGYAMRRAAETGLSVRVSCATNGYLSDSQIEWITKNIHIVNLSFDGLPSTHDRHRLTLYGSGSSDRVMNTMRRFDKAGIRYGVRVTVTSDQVSLLPESIAFIYSNFAPTRIQVEPAYQLGRYQGSAESESQEFLDAYRQAQARASEMGREICFSGARAGTITAHFCGATKGNFCLSPDGNVSSCYEAFSEDVPFAESFFYGSLNEDGEFCFDRDILRRLRAQAVTSREYCQGCFAKWSCGGDCYYKLLTVSKGGPVIGSARCHIIRELTKDQILYQIAESGGVVWSGADDKAPAAAPASAMLEAS